MKYKEMENMRNKFINFLLDNKAFPAYTKKRLKRGKTMDWVEANLHPAHWIDSVFLWEGVKRWEILNKKWLQTLNN